MNAYFYFLVQIQATATAADGITAAQFFAVNESFQAQVLTGLKSEQGMQDSWNRQSDSHRTTRLRP